MYQGSQNRSRPHVSIPPGAQHPLNANPATRTVSPYNFQLTPPVFPVWENDDPSLVNPWDAWDMEPSSPDTARPRSISAVDLPPRLPHRTSSASDNGYGVMSFPEPQISRSVSQRTPLRPDHLNHRYNRSDLGVGSMRREASSNSLASSYGQYDDDYGRIPGEYPSDKKTDDISTELSNLSLDSEEGLRRFQAGELPVNDEEWHRLVPIEAQDSLGKQEVQRQSVIFEIFKGEREYVSDLEAVQEVFIDGLVNANPPIMREPQLTGFITAVFGNFNQILSHHQRMLAALFARQREQHPFILSVADIILDTTLKADFRSGYEMYIKHYPISEQHHRNELKRNPAYEAFVQSASSDPRIRKRDLITFLSRPVTRLPRLNLVLEQILKLTAKEYEHPDLETLPIILGILSDCIKSTQPGIEAAESKVKFWGLCESLQYQKGEIIDMDLYDESRTLVYAGPLARRQRDSDWSGFADLYVALLDNYLLLTREEKDSTGATKRHLMSRPLPLSFLRLGSFDSPSESRKEPAEDGRLLESLRHRTVPVYPFTVYHASAKSTRRYTLYAVSESVRNKWRAALEGALGLHKAREHANMWFDARTWNNSFFRIKEGRVAYSSGAKFTGKVTSAVPFSSGGRNFLVVGCSSGIYAAPHGEANFRKVLNYSNPTSIAAIQTFENKVFNRFLVHFENTLLSYSLDILARVASGQVQPDALDASLEKIAGQDGNVLFFRVAHIGRRMLVVYASKKTFQVTLNINVLEALDISEINIVPKRPGKPASSFRPFGDAGYVPKDAFEVTPLVKKIAISTSDGIIIADPTNLAKSAITVVPDLSGAPSNLPVAALKSRLEDTKPLGLVRCDASELLVVYDEVGFYITKHGVPSRSSGYIKWETKAASYAAHGVHVLLFSSQFIEVRKINTGRLVQVIEANDVRLLHCGPTRGTDDKILAVMRRSESGDGDKDGVGENIVEIVETMEFISGFSVEPRTVPALWDEWDM